LHSGFLVSQIVQRPDFVKKTNYRLATKIEYAILGFDIDSRRVAGVTPFISNELQLFSARSKAHTSARFSPPVSPPYRTKRLLSVS
jgi:hypothetical protein